MKSRTIAIVGSIAALTFAAAPVTAIAATHANHRPATGSRLDRSYDSSGARHTDSSPDANSSSDSHNSADSNSPSDSSLDR